MASGVQGPQILLVAYAIDPERGSEPGTGWMWALAAAQVGRVRVLCGNTEGAARALEKSLKLDIELEISIIRTPLDNVLPSYSYIRYTAWMLIGSLRLWWIERRIEKGAVGHHVTYASDWLPSPLLMLRRTPFVWGPVGGATTAPRSLVAQLPLRARLEEALRKCVGAVGRATTGRLTARRAALVVALNEDTARSYRRVATTVIEPNAALDYSTLPVADAVCKRKAVYVGRLVRYKGIDIALRAFADPRLRDWELEVYGDGPLASKVVQMARDGGGHISFHGSIDRSELLQKLARSAALVFPSLHDSAPWTAAEAAGMGVPVLCYPLGGAPYMAGACARLLDPRRPVESLVEFLLTLDFEAREPVRALDKSRVPAILSSWYDLCLQAHD